VLTVAALRARLGDYQRLRSHGDRLDDAAVVLLGVRRDPRL
jgi:hypothetical protein